MITATTVKFNWHGLSVMAEITFDPNDIYVNTRTVTVPGSDYDIEGCLAPFALRAIDEEALTLAMEALR
jgi:hypothetical protein